MHQPNRLEEEHERTGRSVRSGGSALHPAGPPAIMNIHNEATKIANGGGDEPTEFLVSVETYDVMNVRAATPEEALAKAVTGNPEGSDFDIEVITHDVHACVHSGEEIEHEHEEHDEE